EGHDDAIAHLEVLHVATDLHHLAHEFVTDDVAGLHERNEPVVEVEIGAADRGRRHAHDRVVLVEDLRIGHVLDAHVLLAVPYGRFHRSPPTMGCPGRCMTWPGPSGLPSERVT